MDYKVKDMRLAEQGNLQLEWGALHMPALMEVRKGFEKNRPFRGYRISAILHVTKETGVLMRCLKAGGADIALAGGNPLSTQDDVAAALAKDGIRIYAWRGETVKEYDECAEKVLDFDPDIIIDDGGDLHTLAHKHKERIRAIGGTEETTSGINRERSMERHSILKYPIIAVNNAYTKYLFDNRYGTGQSTIDGIIRATNIFIPGKVVVVAGYGWVGRGVAMRMKGHGARVIVTEVDPFKALEANMDGFDVMPMDRAARLGDIFVTATGDMDVIVGKHMRNMRDGAILSNTGHFDVEVNVKELREMAVKHRKIRDHLEEYTLRNGKRLFLLAEGRIVNLGAAEGHPSEVMDLSFCNQALSALYLIENKGKLENKVYKIPDEVDRRIASIKLKAIGIGIDRLSERQKEYLGQWDFGT
ncbi:MAG: adenosylhomocysteinase [Candidatus Marsarchaeota archaeon]|nr:adenosylhomocysteinase [Candidatus Marsarchaeota archaeon]MCL5413563.1 adenosylhomocysteinase [Candidatus Marsarchaeota archaeon]